MPNWENHILHGFYNRWSLLRAFMTAASNDDLFAVGGQTSEIGLQLMYPGLMKGCVFLRGLSVHLPSAPGS
jgi:hypothetical protein